VKSAPNKSYITISPFSTHCRVSALGGAKCKKTGKKFSSEASAKVCILNKAIYLYISQARHDKKVGLNLYVFKITDYGKPNKCYGGKSPKAIYLYMSQARHDKKVGLNLHVFF
jgi:hypothetical protein